MLVFEEIIINYDKLDKEIPIVRDVHIDKGIVTYIDPREKLKNLEECKEGN
tara:strand:+ start:410 stop:562 length:153 start_codon:yes stop_codon:yes gene_type:complete